MTHRDGDKVRIKAGPKAGSRAVIVRADPASCVVRLVDSEQMMQVPESRILNYSLAARKAWLKMPRRNVGRPFGTRVCDRVSVTLRIDRDLWSRFRAAEAGGRIDSRTSTINEVLRQFLDRLTRREKKAS